MPTPIKLAPSILAADFLRLGEQVAEAEAAGAERLHFDVMDGQFVPNISIGIPVLQSLRPATRLPIETHLMIQNPDNLLEAFALVGSDTIQVHWETCPHLHRTIHHIKSLGKKAGVVLNPGTPASVLEEILPDLDIVLVMTVNPGFGGQRFISSMLPKIRHIRQMINQINPQIELEVDGGIDAVTAPLVVAAGANVLVAGSAIFRAPEGILQASRKILAAGTEIA